MLYGETPCNPNMAILDLAEFGKLGRSLEHVLTMVDSTFASPYLQPVIKHGIDISMHSWHVILILNREGKNVFEHTLLRCCLNISPESRLK